LWQDGIVRYLDQDGDIVEFRLTFNGELHAHSNGVHLTSITDLRVDYGSGKIHFGDYSTKPQSKVVLPHVRKLNERHKEMKLEKQEAIEGKPEVSEYAKWALNLGSDDAEPDVPTVEVADTPGSDKGASSVATAKVAFEKEDEQLSDLEAQMVELDQKLKYFEDGPRWASLVGACVEKRFVGYLYSICFFDLARQGATKLGKFTGWAAHGHQKDSAMQFSGGDLCPGGPHRSLLVKLLCGPSMALKAVSEPSRCVYEADVEHPSACTQEALDALLNSSIARKPLRPHEEL